MPRITTDLDFCARTLRDGGVAAMPTETVYGLAASVNSIPAIRRLFETKERPLFDPLIVHIADIEQKNEVVREWPAAAARLAERFWPGPMTLVLPKRPAIDPLITAGLDTVGLRQPRHPLARALIRAVGAPLAAPSANRFGRTSPTSARHVADEFPGADFPILDGGECEVGLESTVIALDAGPGSQHSRERITILRPGFVTREMLEEAFADWPRRVEIVRASSPASPGNLSAHYRPRIPLVIVAERAGDGPADAEPRARAALSLASGVGAAIRLDPSPVIAARGLYADMRTLGAGGADFLFVRRSVAQTGRQWDAVWDRLEKAATAMA